MSEIKIGDTIKCSNLDEAIKYCDAIEAEGYEYALESDFKTAKWIIEITGKKERRQWE